MRVLLTPAPRAPVPASPRRRSATAPSRDGRATQRVLPRTPASHSVAQVVRQAVTQMPRQAASPAPREARVAMPRVAGLNAASAPPDLAWPETFDDWMIDIVRRRALRLNSGARRRGARGSVRAVELGHILEHSKDANGRWICSLCTAPVTLADLSFDHVVALADGGEHAAYNLVPAHRKCNEIKGSEKAQYKEQALDRWLNEWADTHDGAMPRGASRHHLPIATPAERAQRYA